MGVPRLERVGYVLRDGGVSGLLGAGHRYAIAKLLPRDRRLSYFTWANHVMNRLRFDAVADPWEPVTVAPGDGGGWNREISVYHGLGQVRGGDWDDPRHCDALAEHWVVDGLRERFEEGRAWEDTRYVRVAADRIEHEGDCWGYERLDAFIERRCAFVDRLYEHMAAVGYAPDRSGPEVPVVDSRHGKPRHAMHPLVCLTRTGDFVYRDGIHRVAIARLLDLDIQTYVLARHLDWQRTREAMRSRLERAESVPSRWADHPDVKDMVRG